MLRETQDATGAGEGTYVIEFQGESYAAYQDTATAGDTENQFGVSVVDNGGGTNVAGNTVGYVQNDSGDLVEVTNDGTNFATGASDITGGTGTPNPLETLDSALNTVDSLRSELGAVQNRFESAISNLSTNETNLSAARSRNGSG